MDHASSYEVYVYYHCVKYVFAEQKFISYIHTVSNKLIALVRDGQYAAENDEQVNAVWIPVRNLFCKNYFKNYYYYSLKLHRKNLWHVRSYINYFRNFLTCINKFREWIFIRQSFYNKL